MGKEIDIEFKKGNRGPYDKKVILNGEQFLYETLLERFAKWPREYQEDLLALHYCGFNEERNNPISKGYRGGDWLWDILREVAEFGKLTEKRRRELTEKSNG